jgi:hypothetical protein
MNCKSGVVSICAGVLLLAGTWAAGAEPPAAPDSKAPAAPTEPVLKMPGTSSDALKIPANSSDVLKMPPMGRGEPVLKMPAPPAAPAPSAAAPGAAPSADAPSDFKTLDQEVQGLKKDVIDLNKDLFVLEEELLFPANTQVAVYVSMDVGTFFALDSVTVKIDNKEVKNYLYTAREADALLKGGVQQIYLGNLKVGKHELVAFFTGKGTVERSYRRGATINFEKGVGAKYLELKVTDKVPKHQPEFTIKDWE